MVTNLRDQTAYLDIRKLAQVGIHRDESVIDQLLMVVSPEHITVLQGRMNIKHQTQTRKHTQGQRYTEQVKCYDCFIVVFILNIFISRFSVNSSVCALRSSKLYSS